MIRNSMLVRAVLVSLLVLLPTKGVAQPYGYSDAWTEEYEEIEGNEFGLFYGFGLTEVDYGNVAGVQTQLFSPSGWTLVDESTTFWSSYANLDVSYNVPESGEDGDYEVRSSHYELPQGGSGWILFAVSNIIVGVNTYYTRYYHVPESLWYRAWFRGNACQKQTALIPFIEPPPYVQGIGKRIRILFWNYCRIGLYPRSDSSGLICSPAM